MSKTIDYMPNEVVERIAHLADLNLGVAQETHSELGALDVLMLSAEAQNERSISENVENNIIVSMHSSDDPEYVSSETWATAANTSSAMVYWSQGHNNLAVLWNMWVRFSSENDEVVFSDITQQLSLDLPSEEGTYVLVRPIGRDWMVQPGSPEETQLKLRRGLMTTIKALLYWRVVTGQMTYADAAETEVSGLIVQSLVGNRYAVWAIARVKTALSLLVACYSFAARLCARITIISDLLAWYNALTEDDQVGAEILFVMFLCVLVRQAYLYMQSRNKLKLVTKIKIPEDKFLGQFMTEKGIHYKVRVAGKEHLLSASGDVQKPDHVDEMAMPGSEFFPCKSQPIGAILVAAEGADLALFGVFWRLDEYLVTARHCSNTLSNSTAKVYAASLRQTKKGNWEIDDTKLQLLEDEFFDSDLNMVTSYDVDVFVRHCEPKFWAQVKVGKASTRVSSAYNLQIHSIGFSDSGLLVSASGRTLVNSGHELLHHTASTKKGFSGSILLCGSSVVGMHVSASDNHNVAIRVEWIKYLIEASSSEESKKRKVYTYADAAYKDQYRENKWRGGVAKISVMRDGNMSIILKDGQASYGWTMHELSEAFGYGDLEKDYDMFEDMAFDQRYRNKRTIEFEDENAPIEPVKSKKTKKTKAKPKEVKCYTVEEGLKPVHGPKAPALQPEIGKVLESRFDEIKALGYQAGEFEYPSMTPESERISLQKHLDLFGKNVKKQKLFPTPDKISRCARVVSELLQANRFMPDHDYKTVGGLVNNIINTSIIGNDKSAGYPYCSQGLPKNGQVLERYTVKGFAQEVLNKWDDRDFDIKVFIKGEPTKLKKIKAEMPRIICGLPLHVTTKHASIFVNMCRAFVDGWKDSPAKYAFVPAKPGHLEHLKEVLPGKVYESDKSNWDFNVLEWKKQVASQVVQLLAIKPPQWDEQQFCDYLIDVEQAFDQMFDENRYRTSDGNLFKMKGSGIMKSGWFCTITVNTIMQIVIDVMIKMELGYEDDEIINNWNVVAGGDDVNQDLEGIDLQKYKKISASLGVDMEIEVRDNLESSEYFSSDIRLVKNKLAYFPKRFTKHVEHLKTVKVDDLPQALLSHMENYRHSPEKFALFENLYHDLRKDYPAQFRVQALKSRYALIDKQYGYECLGDF